MGNGFYGSLLYYFINYIYVCLYIIQYLKRRNGGRKKGWEKETMKGKSGEKGERWGGKEEEGRKEENKGEK